MVENKMTKNKYFYSTTVIALTILGALALFFLVISPFYSKAGSLTTDAKTKQTELKKLQDKKSKLEALKSREDELKKDAETVRNALPEEKDVGRLFIEFDNLAKTSGGTIKSIAEGGAGAAVATAPATTAGATTTTVGDASIGLQKISYLVPIDFKDYFGFKDFVAKTENALRIIGINDFTITTSEKSGGSMNVNLTTTTYVRSK